MLNNYYLELTIHIAYLVQQEVLNAMPGILDDTFQLIADIDATALEQQADFKNLPDRLYSSGWHWKTLLPYFRQRYYRCFELSIWYQGNLAGLMLAKASKHKKIVRICFIEAFTHDQPYLKGKILPISGLCIEVFAKYLYAEWIGIQNPIEAVKPYYRKNGFIYSDPFNPKNNALCKKLS